MIGNYPISSTPPSESIEIDDRGQRETFSVGHLEFDDSFITRSSHTYVPTSGSTRSSEPTQQTNKKERERQRARSKLQSWNPSVQVNPTTSVYVYTHLCLRSSRACIHTRLHTRIRSRVEDRHTYACKG